LCIGWTNKRLDFPGICHFPMHLKLLEAPPLSENNENKKYFTAMQNTE